MNIRASEEKMFQKESERSKAEVRLANVETVTKVCKYKKGNWTSCDKTVMVSILTIYVSKILVLWTNC